MKKNRGRAYTSIISPHQAINAVVSRATFLKQNDDTPYQVGHDVQHKEGYDRCEKHYRQAIKDTMQRLDFFSDFVAPNNISWIDEQGLTPL